ncbi:30S ribosomal protein S6 [Dehalogenimonas sp. THU2]|uniref:30S ribosomal protein S6 n=1 Tax=Dehalogenimonas sp. THU2 TaxID=3151121 RepID=UPI0032181F0A
MITGIMREDTTIAVKEKKNQAMAELLRTRTEPVRSYELVIIYRPELTPEKVDAGIAHVTGLVTGSGGTIGAVDMWGKRKLAYPIKHQAEGIYVLLKFTAVSSLLKKINGDLRISEDVLRHMAVAPEA